MNKRQKVSTTKCCVVDLFVDCLELVSAFLTLKEKVKVQRVHRKWPLLSLSTSESVIVHLASTVIDVRTNNNVFLFVEDVGLTFTFSNITFALKFDAFSEQLDLQRYFIKDNKFDFVTSLTDESKRCSFIVPMMSSFRDTDHACEWMKTRVLEIFHNVLIFVTVMSPFAFRRAS